MYIYVYIFIIKVNGSDNIMDISVILDTALELFHVQ
jgi:hypothetical protein